MGFTKKKLVSMMINQLIFKKIETRFFTQIQIF